MPGWEGSTRRARLPKDWKKQRKDTFAQKGRRCTWLDNGVQCENPATDIDHEEPGDDHSPRNRRPLCRDHHHRKSSREGAEALAAKRREIKKRFRRVEKHPGLIP